MESHDAEFSESGRGHVPAPKPQPDLTMSTDELALRLLTSREHLDRTEAERLLIEVRAVGRPSRFHATPAQLDAFLRVHFAEAGMGPLQNAMLHAADLIDPAKDGGHYPSELADFTPNPKQEPTGWQDIECPGCRAAARRADGLEGGTR